MEHCFTVAIQWLFLAKILYNIGKGTEKMIIQESAEMYLETILRLSETREIVRSIDIAQAMGFSKPSVSRAMKNLRENGYISINSETGSIKLLDAGKEIASSIYSRHKLLSSFLKKIGVSDEIAVEDACRIEHIISEETVEAIKKHLEQMQ